MEYIENIASKYTYSVTAVLIIAISSCVLWLSIQNWFGDWRNWGKRPPGPFGIPIFGYLPFLGKEPWKTFQKMKSKYGDIVGLYLGQNYTVVLNEYKVAKEVLSHPAALNRGPNIFNDFSFVFGFSNDNDKKWEEQRRICFSIAKTLGLGKGYWEDLVFEEISNFIRQIEKSKGEPFDVSHTLSVSSVSIILSLILGRRLQTEKELKSLVIASKFSDQALIVIGPSYPPNFVPGLRKIYNLFRIGKHNEFNKIVKQLTAFVRDEIENHKKNPFYQGLNDFVNMYLEKIKEESNNPNSFFTEASLSANVCVLILGAADTSANTLMWGIRLLAKHQDIQEKMYQEIVASVGKEGRARYEERHEFPYTFAFVLELLRYSSVLPLTTTRQAVDDIHINGYVIPKGSDIFANSWALHNDPNYWDNPDEFRPERFLTLDGRELIKNPNLASFSFGRRNCPGDFVAYRQITFVITEISKAFKITLPDGVKPHFNVTNGLVTQLNPQDLCFKRRV